MFPEWETQKLLTYIKENLEQFSQSTPTKEEKFDFSDTISLSEKFSSSVNKTKTKT